MERIIDEAPITAVTVHRQGATVTRRVAVPADDGWPGAVAVVGLPLAIRAPTVRVRVAAVQGQGRVIAGDARLGVYARPPAETVEPPAAADLRAAERAVTRLEQRLAQVDAELALVERAAIEPRPEPQPGKAPPPSPMGARLALVGFVDALAEARHAERAGLEAELSQAREALADARDRAARASSAEEIDGAALSARIDVPLEVEGGPTGVTLELSYFVPGARWVPAWQVRLAGDGSAATIEMRAHVIQSSGEDWSGVALRLSTAEPLRFSSLPELKSIRIGKAQAAPPTTRGFRPPPTGARALFGDFDRARHRLRPRAPGAAALPAPADAALPGLPEWDPPVAVGTAFGGAAFDDSMDLEGEALMESAAAPPPPIMARAAPAPRGAPPPAPRSPMRKRSRSSGGPPKGGGGLGGPPEAVRAAVLFAGLRLPPPDSADRGRLAPEDRAARWREALTADGRRLRVDPVLTAEAAEREARAAAGVPVPAGTTPVGSHAFDYAWTAASPVDVPGDGGWHSVPLGERELPCALRYVTVPREAPHVFRLATLHNPGRAPLLPGPAELYVDGAYVLSTTLVHVPGGGRFELGLGVEQAIRCARNTHYEEARSDARVVAMAELRHRISIELHNGLGRPADVEVRERVPQPAEGAEVVIEELHVEPLWEGYDQTERGQPILGGRRWRVSVPPGGTEALKATYVAKIYAANELVGGNRREA